MLAYHLPPLPSHRTDFIVAAVPVLSAPLYILPLVAWRKKGLTLDMVTPARIWAADETSVHDMSLAHRAAVFVSVVLPFVGIFAAIALLWNHGVTTHDLVVMIVMYAVAGFGTTIGYHRLLTHRAFETHAPLRALLTIAGCMGMQGPPIKWCAIHRRHHQASDRDGDPHSPHLHGEGVVATLRGFLHAHVGCLFKPDKPDMARSVSDLIADRTIMIVDQLYPLWVAISLSIPAIIGGWWTHSWAGALAGFIWGGLVRIFLMDHVTWSVNSVCHVWGGRPFQSQDHSANNVIVALLSLGEGWHNNHHAFPTSARHGLWWWQFDISYVLIRALGAVKLAWNIRSPNRAAIEAKRRGAKDESVVCAT